MDHTGGYLNPEPLLHSIMNLADSIRGCVWGAALGDALGAPHEFSYSLSLSKYTGRLQHPVVHLSRHHGRRVGLVGQFTDDTEMGLALARSLEHGSYDQRRAVLKYMEWGASKPPFAGRNTRALLFGIKTYAGYQSRRRRMMATPPDTWTQSNGCLMRCFPLVALGDGAAEAAREDCAVTNPHPVCVGSVVAYVTTLVELANGMSARDSVRAALGGAPPAVGAVVRAAFGGDGPRDVADRPTKGWVLHGLWCAYRGLAMVDKGSSFAEVVDWVVRLGGDTDTNACIAGAMAGAKVGLTGLKREPVTLENLRVVRSCGSPRRGGEMDRPEKYSGRAVRDATRHLVAVAGGAT